MKPILFAIGVLWASNAQADIGPRIEVAFVLDATGSMGSYINQARERIRGIARDLSQGTPAPLVRFALVRFRDKSDAYLTQKKDFTGDVDRMAKWLDETRAHGGGDTPEAVLEGLDVAVHKLSWSKDKHVIRLIYLVGDAPPQQYKNGPTVRSVAQAALSKGIVIHSIACGGIGRRGRYFFDRLARMSEGRPYTLSRHRRVSRRSESAPRVKAGLKEAISGSARAYSSSVGIRFTDAGVSSSFQKMLDVNARGESGLIGAHVRYVSDSTTWNDIWLAHLSVHPGVSWDVPEIDFNTNAVVVLGGQDAGVELVDVQDHSERRVLSVRPATNGTRMYRVPFSENEVTVRWVREGKS